MKRVQENIDHSRIVIPRDVMSFLMDITRDSLLGPNDSHQKYIWREAIKDIRNKILATEKR